MWPGYVAIGVIRRAGRAIANPLWGFAIRAAIFVWDWPKKRSRRVSASWADSDAPVREKSTERLRYHVITDY